MRQTALSAPGKFPVSDLETKSALQPPVHGGNGMFAPIQYVIWGKIWKQSPVPEP